MISSSPKVTKTVEGHAINSYKIRRTLGSGAFGKVKRTCLAHGLRCCVALKLDRSRSRRACFNETTRRDQDSQQIQAEEHESGRKCVARGYNHENVSPRSHCRPVSDRFYVFFLVFFFPARVCKTKLNTDSSIGPGMRQLKQRQRFYWSWSSSAAVNCLNGWTRKER